MKILWTETALGHLSAIHKYISSTSTLYADRMIDRVMDRGRQLAAFPESGHLVTETDYPNVRELLEHPYRIIYRVSSEAVEVLAVVHVRREEPGSLGGSS